MRLRLDIAALTLCAVGVVATFAVAVAREGGRGPAADRGTEVAGVTATATPRAVRLPRADPAAPARAPTGSYQEGSLRLEGSVPSDEAGAAYEARVRMALGLEPADVSNRFQVDERVAGPLVVRVDERFGVPGDDQVLGPGLEAFLDVAIAALVRLPEARVVVTGHTDAVGDDATNQLLSVTRAQVVVDAMVRRGVAPDRLTAVGAGESSPVAGNETSDGRAANRRVELRFEGITPGWALP